MSQEDCSPKRQPCRVRSTFDIAEPLNELPPDRETVAQSPETVKRKLTVVNDILANATCEEGTSMDSIATYIPSKATREKMEVEDARLKTAAKAAKIAALEAELKALRSESGDDDADETAKLKQLIITRPTSVVAHAIPIDTAKHSQDSICNEPVQVTPQKIVSPSTRSSLISGTGVCVPPPAIGALVAAPPAMGALMAAPPAIGALVVAALQPAAQSPISDRQENGILTEDFKRIHNEYMEAVASEKTKKKPLNLQ